MSKKENKSKKIVLFLSTLKPGILEKKKEKYTAPNGKEYEGLQTNEAPTKYLCDKYQKDIVEILCIVTDEAEETAWKYFKKSIKKNIPKKKIRKKVKITKIKYNIKQDFSKGPLKEILENINDDDEILFDATGGFRSDIFYLVLINRILTLKGISTIEAVYSNRDEHLIQDITHLIRMFDLVGGVQELISMGNVRTLRDYYENQEQQDVKMNSVLNCMEELVEIITLCKTGEIEDKMKNFNSALQEARETEDQLFKQLVIIYQKKFGTEMDILDLIEWCVDSGLYQQALTVFKEKVPSFIMKNLVKYTGNEEQLLKELSKKNYEDKDEVMFTRGFWKIGNTNLVNGFKEYIKDNNDNIVNLCDNGTEFKIDEKYQTGITNIVIYLDAIYGPCKDKNATEKVSKIAEYFKDNTPKDKSAMINALSKAKVEVINILLEIKMENVYKNCEINTIENMGSYIQSSQFKLNCSVEFIQQISRDYLYVRKLRNMINHANNESTINVEERKYFKYYKYMELEKNSLNTVGTLISNSIKTLREAHNKVNSEISN